jgi:hypothetical protein
MGKTYDCITAELRAFIEQQRMFFVATAPLDAAGHVNVSPKGLDAFRVLGEKRVAYLDLTGSGNETSAHLEQNGRITLMFCAFAGPPKILRLFGRGRTILAGGDGWRDLASRFELRPGARQIIVIDVERVQTSCGFGVPVYEFQGQREMLPAWAEKKGADGIAKYQREKNAASIDGLPTTLGKAMTAS